MPAVLSFVYTTLLESDDYAIISSPKVYVGNIDSDDYETAEFTIYVTKVKEKEIDLPMLVEYKDDNNKGYSRRINLGLRLYSSTEAKKLGLVKSSKFVGISIAIVIVVIGLLAYYYWKKEKK